MEKTGTVRIEALRLTNFKNIGNGAICFSESKKLERGIMEDVNFSNTLGIYGENGSGKTSCIQALRVLQILLTGNPIEPYFRDYVAADQKSFAIGADFLVSFEETNFYVNYDIEIAKCDSGLKILNEKMSYKCFEVENKKNNIFSFSAPNNIKPGFCDFLGSRESEVYKIISLIETIDQFNRRSAFSAIFNPKLVSLVNQVRHDEDFTNIVLALQYFARYRFVIYEINYFNEISKVGIKFRVKQEADGADPTSGDVFVSFSQTNLPKQYFDLFKKTIDDINKVIPSLVKDFKVEIVDVIKTESQSINDDTVNFKLVSNRGGHLFPLYNESNGIKKIISILSGLVDVYNNEGSFMAIDELDSGIFEYLLGEIVYAFDNFAQGQLLFTSHNLRVLEKIDPKNLFFSTIDRNQKFIQIPQVRQCNNLRNLYYRYLAKGLENKPLLYNNVKTEDIISSLFDVEVNDE